MARKGIATETNKVVVSKKGSKSDSKQTFTRHEKNIEIQKEINTPTSHVANVYIVQTKLQRDGRTYLVGEEFTENPSKAIDELLKIGCIRPKTQIAQQMEQEEELDEENNEDSE